MVSNTIDMGLDDLVEALVRLRAEHAEDPEYLTWRAQFPADWTM